MQTERSGVSEKANASDSGRYAGTKIPSSGVSEKALVPERGNARDNGRYAETKILPSGIMAQGSFKRQIILIFVVGFFLLVVAFIAYEVRTERAYLYRDSTDDATSLAESLAASSRSWVLANDVAGLQEVILSFQRHPGLRYAMVISPSGQVLAHSDATKVGQFLFDEQSLTLIKAPPLLRVMRDDESLVDIAVPIMVDHHHVGWARAAQGRERIAVYLNQMMLNGAFFALLAVVLSLFFALLITKRLGHRIGYLMRVAEEVQAGNYGTRANISGADEIATLAKSLNHMLDVLAREEEQLRESEALLQTTIKLLPVGLWVFDADGKITFSNEAAKQIWAEVRHVGVEQLGEYKGWRIGSGKRVEPHEWAGARAIEKGETSIEEEVEIECFDGTRKIILDSAVPLHGSDGSIRGAVTINQDITERKRTEAIRTQLAAIVESSSDAIIGKTPDGIITSWNKSAERIYGYSADEIIGQHVTALAPPSRRAEINEFLEKVRKGGTVVNYESARLRKDGALIQVALTLSPIMDASGNITGISTIARDITERKKAEDALRYSENRFRLLVESSPFCIHEIGMDGRISSMNRAGLVMMGVEDECKIQGFLYLDAVCDADRGRIEQLLARAYAGESSYFEFKASGPGGLIFKSCFVPIKNEDGSVEKLMGITEDITERKNAEFVLRQSEEGLKEAQRMAHLGSWYLDLATNQIFWSEELYKMYGFDPALPPPLYTESMKLFTPESWERLSAAIAKAAETGIPYELELETVQKDGSRGWMLARGEQVCDASGAAVRVRGVAMDITERKLAENVLREKEERLALATVNNGVGIWDWNLQTQEMIWDDSMFALYHIRREDFSGTEEAWRASLHPDDLTRGDQEVADAISGRKPFETEFRVVWPNGEIHYIKAVAKVFRDDQGVPSRMLGINMDVTDRKKAEEALYEAQQMFRSLVENSPDIIARYDRDFRRTYVNPTYLKEAQISQEELIGAAPMQRSPLPAASADVLQNLLRKVLDSGVVGAVDVVWPREDGINHWYNINAFPEFDREGRVVSVMAVSRDITERKKTEIELRELNNDFVTLLENTGDFIYFKDHDSRIRFCSQALASITGHPSWREMIGKHDLEVFPEDTARIYHEEELPIFREGKPLLNKIDPYYDEQGRPRWVNTNKWPVFGDDGKTVVGIFGISRDITELKQAEDKINELNRNLERRVVERTAQLEAANKELEAFSYSVSHDLRTPLRAIDGFSHILLDNYTDKLDEEGRRLLNVVRDNTSRMGQLIDDILKFSRTSRLEMSFSEIDMEGMARSVVEELQPIVAAGRKLQVEIEPIPPVTGDRAMMHQVFVNLLSNAIKFSRSQETATIKVGGGIDGNEAVYYVKDNGAGFDMQYAGKLFGVFQRLHGINEFEGTGIGLAIVKRIITRHGGRVWAESKVNEGATIYFAIPATALT